MALANDIALYALGYWSHEQHPFRINPICLNTRQRKTPCRACTDICPKGIVLHSGKADWSGCINCNLCITACPTAAINQSSTSFEGVRKLILEDDSPVSFACAKSKEGCDVSCTCLATIPWDLAAAAAIEGGVVLKAEACKNCEEEMLVKKVKGLIQDLRHFLGKERFSQTVFMHDQPERMRNAGRDKRLAFDKVADSIGSGAQVALSGEQNPTMSCYRALLLEVLEGKAEQDEPVDVTWQTLVEDGHCRACEICTKMCPHAALEFHIPGYTDKSESADETVDEAPGTAEAEDGEALLEEQYLTHNASKCTQCGLCYVSCPEDNLGGWDDLFTHSVPAYCDYPISVELCAKCGRPFVPASEDETLCIGCKRTPYKPNNSLIKSKRPQR